MATSTMDFLSSVIGTEIEWHSYGHLLSLEMSALMGVVRSHVE
jgi:hypothetical protein